MKNVLLKISKPNEYSDHELSELIKELDKVNLEYKSPLYDSMINLRSDISKILNKRKNSKTILVEFKAVWCGYSSSQARTVAVLYRRIKNDIYEQIPKHFQTRFSDNTYNTWTVKRVNKIGKTKADYEFQVDDMLKKY